MTSEILYGRIEENSATKKYYFRFDNGVGLLTKNTFTSFILNEKKNILLSIIYNIHYFYEILSLFENIKNTEESKRNNHNENKCLY